MNGNSQKLLFEKLGIKPGMKVLFLNEPKDYQEKLSILSDVQIVNQHSPNIDFIQFFANNTADLILHFGKLKKSLALTGMLWICWPKTTSSEKNDLNESVVQEIGLSNGLVDVKVIAVDNVWSGLKFVYRLKDRI